MAELDILLVEDNHGDIRLVEQAFDERKLPGALHPVRTGEEALDWLYRRGEFAEAPRPDLILLDLNLPATSGHAVVDEIKSEPGLKRIPIIILTGSRSEDDLVKMYERGANACLIKPVDPDDFADIIQRCVDFWSGAVALPPSIDSAPEELQDEVN